MKCLVVVGALGRGGAERQAVLATHAMGIAGVDARLFVCRPPLHQLDEARALGVEVDAPAGREHPARQLWRLRAALCGFAPDGVLTFLTSAGVRHAIARSLARGGREAAWLYTVRGNYTANEFMEVPLRSAFRQVCLRAADRVIANSASLASNTIASAAFTAAKLEIVPNVLLPLDGDGSVSPDAVAARLGIAPGSPLVGAIGSIREERNYELLVRALAILRRRFPSARLAIVGRSTGPECEGVARALRRVCGELGVADAVLFAGELAAARELAAGFDVFVVSSKLEGSSNALAEAIVAGAAIASTPVGDAPELIGDGGVVASGWTPDALASAILRVLEDPAGWRRAALRRRDRLLEARSPRRVGAEWLRVLTEARRTRGGVGPS
jgi:glycosyltransferase involved in cell wall biosynthesis